MSCPRARGPMSSCGACPRATSPPSTRDWISVHPDVRSFDETLEFRDQRRAVAGETIRQRYFEILTTLTDEQLDLVTPAELLQRGIDLDDAGKVMLPVVCAPQPDADSLRGADLQ